VTSPTHCIISIAEKEPDHYSYNQCGTILHTHTYQLNSISKGWEAHDQGKSSERSLTYGGIAGESIYEQVVILPFAQRGCQKDQGAIVQLPFI